MIDETETPEHPKFLPQSLAWHGTSLAGDHLTHAVGALSGLLRKKGVGGGHLVALENDGTGRSVLALLALANLNARVVLTDRPGKLDRYQASLPDVNCYFRNAEPCFKASRRYCRQPYVVDCAKR